MLAYTDWPADEHMVSPHEKAQHGNGDAGKGHEVIAEDALPGESR